MDSIDTLIIGAGALGLACAAGLYYAPGSLKAELCLEGRERLYAWCARHRVAHRRTGKLLVAVSAAERGQLDALLGNAQACGVHDLEYIEQSRLATLEPAVRGVAALLSPSSGIIDSHAYLQSLLAAAENQGAQLVLQTRVDH